MHYLIQNKANFAPLPPFSFLLLVIECIKVSLVESDFFSHTLFLKHGTVRIRESSLTWHAWAVSEVESQTDNQPLLLDKWEIFVFHKQQNKWWNIKTQCILGAKKSTVLEKLILCLPSQPSSSGSQPAGRTPAGVFITKTTTSCLKNNSLCLLWAQVGV